MNDLMTLSVLMTMKGEKREGKRAGSCHSGKVWATRISALQPRRLLICPKIWTLTLIQYKRMLQQASH